MGFKNKGGLEPQEPNIMDKWIKDLDKNRPPENSKPPKDILPKETNPILLKAINHWIKYKGYLDLDTPEETILEFYKLEQ